ncbi:MAG: leucine-rich repeat domain-containing protein, partial [Eubacterium sp.]|nr:leucine-rich repeat domain-containing protein [Eubacterium sp.]
MENKIEKKGYALVFKKAFCLLLSLVMLFSIAACIDLSAYAATSEDYEYEILDDGTVEITKYLGSDSIVSIPSAIDGKQVTSIGGYAFSKRTDLTHVTIKYGVKNIALYAFSDCTGLTNITLPDSVTSIGYMAFYDCENLASITLPNSITSISQHAFTNTAYYNNQSNWSDGVLYIGNYLIKADEDVVSGTYSIKNGTTLIAVEAFLRCRNLTSIIIPNSIISIDPDSFYDCYSLKSFIVNPNNKYYSSEDGVLYNIDQTEIIRFPISKTSTTFTIPSNVTSIGASAFSYCRITGITIPDSVINIGDSAFALCDSLTSVKIPNSVTSIGDRAFSYCSGLTSITIPNSVKSLGASAFSNCKNLASITMPDKISSIGYSSFSNTAYYNDQSNWNKGVLYIGACLIKADNKVISGVYSIKIGTTIIADSAFSSCQNLTGVILPNSVTSICKRAFSSCKNLASVTIPNSVTSIGD